VSRARSGRDRRTTLPLPFPHVDLLDHRPFRDGYRPVDRQRCAEVAVVRESARRLSTGSRSRASRAFSAMQGQGRQHLPAMQQASRQARHGTSTRSEIRRMCGDVAQLKWRLRRFGGHSGSLRPSPRSIGWWPIGAEERRAAVQQNAIQQRTPLTFATIIRLCDALSPPISLWVTARTTTCGSSGGAHLRSGRRDGLAIAGMRLHPYTFARCF